MARGSDILRLIPAGLGSGRPGRRGEGSVLRSDASGDRGGVDVEGVSHRFSESTQSAPVLEDITVHIKTGEFVVLVGPSGCGKTTVLNLVAGLIPVQEGSICVAGEPPRLGNRNVGYMLARDALLGWRTALRNVEFGAAIRGHDPRTRRQHAQLLLKQVGLEGYERFHPKALSQGMRQRVALARTFCLDSSVLLMDEPFASIDPQTKTQMWQILLELWTRQQRTVLFITHDVSEAIALADRVIVMARKPGRIVDEILIDLPRPRDIRGLQADPRFHRLQTAIWNHLKAGSGCE